VAVYMTVLKSRRRSYYFLSTTKKDAWMNHSRYDVFYALQLFQPSIRSSGCSVQALLEHRQPRSRSGSSPRERSEDVARVERQYSARDHDSCRPIFCGLSACRGSRCGRLSFQIHVQQPRRRHEPIVATPQNSNNTL
jgi:hypothetical protein